MTSNRHHNLPPILLIAASKGGSGKTTIATHLAALSARTLPTVLVDLDPQQSAASWWRRRSAEAPQLVEAQPRRLVDVQVQAAGRGAKLLIVDSAPRADVRSLARLASFVLIPSRAGLLDLEAVGVAVEAVAGAKARGAIVLNGAPPGRAGREASIVREARASLAHSPIPVYPASVGLLAPLSHSLIAGLGICEYEPDGRAAREIEALLTWTMEEMKR